MNAHPASNDIIVMAQDHDIKLAAYKGFYPCDDSDAKDVPIYILDFNFKVVGEVSISVSATALSTYRTVH